MNRVVEPELLDELPPHDPRAARSRRDLRRLNRVMGHPRIMAQALAAALNGHPTSRIVELGAGDGDFLLRVARRLAAPRQTVAATLVDRLDVLDPEARGRFDRLGWRVDSEIADAIDWLRRSAGTTADVMFSNLLLHHFQPEPLAELLRLASCSTRAFIALEPARARLVLGYARFLWLLGCGPVTRHDACVSIRAGFAAHELSSLWPNREDWELTERRAGLFSHLFIARRKG